MKPKTEKPKAVVVEKQKVHCTNVFVGSGDSPDDRQVKFVLGHMPKEEFALLAGCPVDDVKHVYARMEKEDEHEPDFAWWGPELDRAHDLTRDVTMAFV